MSNKKKNPIKFEVTIVRQKEPLTPKQMAAKRRIADKFHRIAVEVIHAGERVKVE